MSLVKGIEMESLIKIFAIPIIVGALLGVLITIIISHMFSCFLIEK